ncbi:MAG: NAD(P)H-binding protein [Gemmatimonadaceae bacterium]|nr:NAD(P)H-binding protein [Gemmatimonadaceae bacterium]
MLIVTGASGHLGHAIVERLLDRIPSSEIGVSVRDAAKAANLAARGVRVRQADFDDPHSLQHAFEGASQVLLVSSNARATGGDTLAQHRSAIDTARAVGAQRIVYTSHMAVSESSAFPPMRDHFSTERLLAESGVAWTALRNGFYAASGIAMMGDAFDTGVLVAPADGPVSWTAHADLAEAAAMILHNPGTYDGPTPPLTGAESLDFASLAALTSEVRDTPVRREIITDDVLRARIAARGAPERTADTVLGFFIASRNREFAAVDPTLEQLLGRRPIAMRELLAERVSQHATARA